MRSKELPMTIHLEATFPVAPERVYELLINGARFGEVTGKPGKGGGSAGAAFSLFGDWLEGRQVELVPSERVVQAWRFTSWEPGVYSIVRFTLTREGAGTKLTVHHEGYPAEFHEHLSTNWRPFYFDPFAKHFAA
jgi:activator of HSP90 ATPase